MHREYKNFGVWNRLSDSTYGRDSIQFRHADIDYGHIRFQLDSFLYRLSAIRCLADNPPAALGTKDRPRTTPHQPVVVSYQNAKVFHVRSLQAVLSPAQTCRDWWNQSQDARRSASLALACWGCRHQLRTPVPLSLFAHWQRLPARSR